MNSTTTKPTPTAEDLADLRDLAWSVLDRAVARFNETRAHADRTRDLLDLDPSLNQWVELETRLAVEAESHLVNCILATDPQSDQLVACDLERFRAPTRGVRSGGVTYLAAPQEPHDTDPGRYGGPMMMRLVVIQGEDAILDMEDTTTFSRLTQRAQRTSSTVEPPPPPPTPVWLLTVIKAAEDLGETEALRRILATDLPGWLLTIIWVAKDLGETEALRRILATDLPGWLLTIIRVAKDLGETEALRRIFNARHKPAG